MAFFVFPFIASKKAQAKLVYDVGSQASGSEWLVVTS